MLKEFKAFIMRGNVIDLATGVIIGAAFGKIVNSIVNDIIMPPLGLLINNVDFKDLKQVIGGTNEAPVTINYGNFIQIIIEFLIIAFCIFILVKAFNSFSKKEESLPPPPTLPTREEEILVQIRDLLRNK
jgi:large conductance mechanosensitive channel